MMMKKYTRVFTFAFATALVALFSVTVCSGVCLTARMHAPCPETFIVSGISDALIPMADRAPKSESVVIDLVLQAAK